MSSKVMIAIEQGSDGISQLEPSLQKQKFESIKLRIWRGSVPIHFAYGDSTIQLNAPRLSYLPLTFPKVRETFKLDQNLAVYVYFETDSGTSSMEFVPTHLPIGLIYDIQKNDHRPLRLTVSCGTPETEPSLSARNPASTMNELRFSIMNALKENEFMRRYTIRRFQDLTPQESQDLYQSMLYLDFINYSKQAQTLTSLDDLRFLPLRLYLDSRTSVQDLISPRTAGERTTIKHALQKLVPDLEILGPTVVEIVLHGVVVDWDLDLLALLEEAAYVDGWLYLILRESSTIVQPARYETLKRSDSARHEASDPFS